MTLRPRPWIAPCALCIITLLAWANSFESGFVYDNGVLILGDKRIRRATPDNLAQIFNHTYWWPSGVSGLYRPVITLSYLFNYAILGNADHPAGYHAVNLLLHAGNVLLVFALARRLIRDLWPSFLIAAVWAVHPVLTESVTNIVGRADLLAGMTTLGGLLIYLKSAETHGWRRLAWLAGLMAVTVIGVFSKESAVAVIAVIALYELTWWNPRRLRGILLSCLAMSPAFLAMWWMRSRALAADPPTVFPFVDNPIIGAGFWTGRLTAVKVIARYLGLLVWPAHLSADYSYAQVPLADGRLTDWIAWIVVAAVAIGAAFLYRRNKTAFFAAGFAFVTLLPASNLVIPVGTIMAERFLYLPAIGFSICLVAALYSLARRLHVTPLAPAMLCLMIAGFGARTWARNQDWRTDFTFWSAAVETAPLSFKTHTGLAQAMYTDHLGLDGVLRENERSLAILDSVPDGRNSAVTYLRTAAEHIENGRKLTPPESTAEFERAKIVLHRALSIIAALHKVERDKDAGLLGQTGDRRLITSNADTRALVLLSEAEQGLGNTEESLRSAREARETGPAGPEVYARLHDVLLTAGRRDEALAALMEGSLITSDHRLQRKLIADYADRPEDRGCAISYARAAPEVNFSCPAVHKQVCSVSADVIRLGLKAFGRETAERLKNEFGVKFGCAEAAPSRIP
jgi:hypothetical protein